VTGFVAGEDAATYALGNERQDIDAAYAEWVISRVLAPMDRPGEVDASDITFRVHEAIVPMQYNRVREARRMNEALGILRNARERLQVVGAADFHDLARYHSAESMLMAAEFTYSAALAREESRSQHFREDFPARDDKNWFKWLNIEQQDGSPKVSTMPVPLHDYRLQPNP
jgi:succinate dehydrogenase/fumarate reductase flavoprotein subunit